VLKPGLADLFKALIIAGSAAHPIEILRNDRVVVVGRLEPMKWLVSVITGSCSYPKTDKTSIAASLFHGGQISNDNIGPRD
jgi:hypothetical protein